MSDKTASLLSKGGSFKGKDDSATKSAKGRRVQFAKEGPFDSPRSGGKGDFSSKGGKGDKVANGGKIPKDSEPKIGQDLPKNVKCLMDCEAANSLQGIQDQMVMLSRDPTIKIPASFDKGLQYAKSNRKYTNPESVRLILEPLTDYGLTDNELCLISNVCPETADEVYALVPSLKGKKSITSQLLKDSLSELAKLRKPI